MSLNENKKPSHASIAKMLDECDKFQKHRNDWRYGELMAIARLSIKQLIAETYLTNY